MRPCCARRLLCSCLRLGLFACFSSLRFIGSHVMCLRVHGCRLTLTSLLWLPSTPAATRARDFLAASPLLFVSIFCSFRFWILSLQFDFVVMDSMKYISFGTLIYQFLCLQPRLWMHGGDWRLLATVIPTIVVGQIIRLKWWRDKISGKVGIRERKIPIPSTHISKCVGASLIPVNIACTPSASTSTMCPAGIVILCEMLPWIHFMIWKVLF